jgi:hypothetical protein
VPWLGFRLATVYAVAVHADLLETVGRNRAVRALIGLRARCGVGLGFRARRGCRGMAELRHALVSLTDINLTAPEWCACAASGRGCPAWWREPGGGEQDWPGSEFERARGERQGQPVQGTAAEPVLVL